MSRGFGRPSLWAWVLIVAGTVWIAVAIPLVVLHKPKDPVSKAELARMDAAEASAEASEKTSAVPVVAFLGDSWTAGSGATGNNGYAPRTADELHWRGAYFGVPSSGYTTPGPEVNGTTYSQRIDTVLRAGADIIVVQGSLNDAPAGEQKIEDDARQCLIELKQRAQHATILVVGSSYTPSTSRDGIDQVNAALAKVTSDLGLRFVNPAAEWTDPDDAAIWHDGKHPNDKGHQIVADHLAAVLKDLPRPAG